MSQIIIDTKVTKGNLQLQNIPLEDDTEVKIIVIPKAILHKMSFLASQKLSSSIQGNLSKDISDERNTR
jgi:hypothetical protein